LPVSEFKPEWQRLMPPWLAALGMSALLVGAGRRWSTPLLEQPWALAHPQRPATLALLLVLLPPLLMALWLAAGMVRHHDRGESSD
jgi:hypothetical protein